MNLKQIPALRYDNISTNAVYMHIRVECYSNVLLHKVELGSIRTIAVFEVFEDFRVLLRSRPSSEYRNMPTTTHRTSLVALYDG